MKSFEDYLDDNDAVIEVGQLCLRPLDEFTVWIEDETGEGMAIEKKILEGHLLRCIKEHFKQ